MGCTARASTLAVYYALTDRVVFDGTIMAHETICKAAVFFVPASRVSTNHEIAT